MSKVTKALSHVGPDLDRLRRELQSIDDEARASALRSLCPCRASWEAFEQLLPLVERLKKDPNPEVRSVAMHVLEDAYEMQCSGIPTHRREATNEMLRTKRASRFGLEAEDVHAIQNRQVERRRERDRRRSDID